MNGVRLLALAAGALMLVGTPLRAQVTELIGAEVYAKNCANQYCHGAAGAAGAAPAVAGRGFSGERLSRVIREGVENTSMPGWEKALSLEDLEAVIAYALSVQQTGVQGPSEKLDPERAWLGHPGRELFFDANRITPCGSCRAFDGLGLSVASPFEGAPTIGIPDLRTLRSDKVVTVEPDTGDPFPAIRAEAKAGFARWYDLGAELPVLRTFKVGSTSVRPGSSWSHAGALSAYSDVELETIFEVLREALTE